jgi:hypothetical protein
MADAPRSGIIEEIMAYQTTRRRKPVLSEHQKQIRFFTRLSVVLCALFALALLWLLNRTSFITH